MGFLEGVEAPALANSTGTAAGGGDSVGGPPT